MSIEQDIYAELQQLLSEYRQTLSVDTSDLLTLDRAAAGDAALTRWHEAGQSRYRAGLAPGSDDWRLQRSPNGTEQGYQDVLTVDRVTGQVAAQGLGFLGAAGTGVYPIGATGLGFGVGGAEVLKLWSGSNAVEIALENGGQVRLSEYSIGASPRLILNADKTHGARAYVSLRHDDQELAAFYTNYSGAASRADFIVRNVDLNGNIDFMPGNSFAARMGADGRVGIGTNSPSEKLDVDGYARAKGFYTADVLVPNDTAVAISTPSNSGVIFITNQPGSGYPQSNYGGFALYDVGTSPDIIRLGGGVHFYTMNADVTGTIGTDPGVTVGVVAGAVKIENRYGGAMTFRYTIIG